MNKNVFFFCILFISIQSASAATYTCCKNFEPDNGTLLSDFESLDGWSADPLFPTTTIGNDSRKINGTGSMWMLGVPASGTGSIIKTLSTPLTFNQIRNGGFWVYIDNTSAVANITLIFLNTSSKYASKLYPSFVRGWNRLVFNTSSSDFVYTDFNNSIPVTQIKLRVKRVVGATTNTNVSFDEFKYDMKGRAKVIMTFDDAAVTVYNNAYPILKANNQRAVVFAPITFIGNGTRWMTLSNIKTLYSDGWDISGHGYNHEHLDTLSVPQIAIVMNQSYDNLTSWGFIRSNRFMAYPYGDYDNDVINETRKTFSIGADIIDLTEPQIHIELNNALDNYNKNYYLYRHWPDDPSIPATLTKINRTIDLNGTLVLAFHNVTAIDNNGDSISTENFTKISDYLASRSDIDVITFSDFLIEDRPSASFQAVSPTIDLLGLIISLVFVIMIFNMFINKSQSVKTPEELVKYMFLAVIAIYLVIASIGAFTVF